MGTDDTSSQFGALLRQRRIAAGLSQEELGKLGGLPFQIALSAMGRARPGEVIVSGTVRDLVAGSDIQFEEHHERLAADVLGSWQLFRVAR
jgi:transcriptional regulator with XRE-family HTH domain